MGYIKESERYQIEILLKEKYTVKQIANILGHKYHTIYAEIRKGTVKQLDTHLREYYVYRADYAQRVYRENVANRGRNLKIGNDLEFSRFIEKMVKEEKYSPEAILYYIRNNGIKFNTHVCFKTIYNYLDSGVFLNADSKNLPYKKDNKFKEKSKPRISIHNVKGTSIEKRSENINLREDFGHWEMDTVYSARGQGKACLLVLSERKGRGEIVIKIKDRTSGSVVSAIDKLERKMGRINFSNTFKSITCDNGVEFSDFEGIEKSKNGSMRTKVYYCHAYCSWERGTNENINRMIRRIYPKGTNFENVTDDDIKKMQDWINNYPRGILGGISSIDYYKQFGLFVA